MNYSAYVESFNTGEDRALVDRFFHDDVVFTGGAREYHGKAELLQFLHWAHQGVREVMRPQQVLQREDMIFAEIDMDFHASKPRPEFPFGALLPGDQVTVKFFVTYRMSAGKVIELKAMTWPPGKGVSRLPRLGGHASQKAAFESYAAAFSAAEFERFSAFYRDDVLLELGSLPPIRGASAIVDFYRKMFATVREELTIHKVLADDEAISLDATTRFTAIADAPDFAVGALQMGDYIEGRVFVHYTLIEGLISSIRVGRSGEMRRVAAGGRA